MPGPGIVLGDGVGGDGRGGLGLWTGVPPHPTSGWEGKASQLSLPPPQAVWGKWGVGVALHAGPRLMH